MGEKTLDRVGIAASTLCALHCMLGAVLAGSAGMIGVVGDERVELVFLAFVLPLATVAMVAGFRKHGNVQPSVLAALGFVAIVAARVVEFGVEIGEVVFSVLGASLLIAAHVWNLRALREHADCCTEPAS